MESLIIGALMTLVGIFVGYLTGYAKKKGENLATHEDIARLVNQVSKVTEATKQIEARIDRSSRVHERQLVVLQKLYRHLADVQALSVRMTAAGRYEKELPPEGYASMVVKAIETARDDFLNGKLFMPPEVVEQCERFFGAAFDVQRQFAVANIPMIDPNQRAELSKTAATIAHQQLPLILKQIEKVARDVIHGKTS